MRLLALLIVLLSLPLAARGQSTAQPVIPGYQSTGVGAPSFTPENAMTPVASAQYGLTVATATSLIVPAGASTANVEIEGAPVRCTTDGSTTPTASVGVQYQPGIIVVRKPALSNLQCIQTAATATLNVEYFR